MKILAVGGGSGGHVTPVAAVLEELRRRDSAVEVRFWCDRKFAPQAREVMEQVSGGVLVRAVISGKLRRYHDVSLWRQLADIPTLLQNIRDIAGVAIGFVQSVVLLLFWRPDVVFTKGGFVCLPVGMAAALLRIRLVIHDSDAHPGLTNRILARWATAIATGAPLENYPYPKTKSRYVGIPISRDFHAFSASERRTAKEKLGISSEIPLVVVTGGGLGAKRINDAMIAIAEEVMKQATVIHISGRYQFSELQQRTPKSDRYKLLPFIDNTEMAQMLGAADVAVVRAGATTLLELAALGAPSVIIPNRQLTGGHQIKNAFVYEEANAAVVIDETTLEAEPQVLERAIIDLLRHETKRLEMGARMRQFARPEAAKEMTDMIVAVAQQKQSRGEA